MRWVSKVHKMETCNNNKRLLSSNWKRMAGVFHHLSQWDSNQSQSKSSPPLPGATRGRVYPPQVFSLGVERPFCTFTTKTWINDTLVSTLGKNITPTLKMPPPLYFFLSWDAGQQVVDVKQSEWFIVTVKTFFMPYAINKHYTVWTFGFIICCAIFCTYWSPVLHFHSH